MRTCSPRDHVLCDFYTEFFDPHPSAHDRYDIAPTQPQPTSTYDIATSAATGTAGIRFARDFRAQSVLRGYQIGGSVGIEPGESRVRSI